MYKEIALWISKNTETQILTISKSKQNKENFQFFFRSTKSKAVANSCMSCIIIWRKYAVLFLIALLVWANTTHSQYVEKSLLLVV